MNLTGAKSDIGLDRPDQLEDFAFELVFLVPEDLAAFESDPPDDWDFSDELEDPEPFSDFAEESDFVLSDFEASADELEVSEELVPESADVLVLLDDDRASFL